jgi:DNA-binding transcriptional LysR family regulator
MDPRQLTYFRVTARHEHMGKAAAELGMSDSTLSRSISRLEKRCGAELFDRVGRGLRLNAYGRVLLTHVDRALSELDNGEREIQAMVNGEQTAIGLGFTASLGVQQVPDLVTQFTRSHPNAHFRLRQASGAVLHDELLDGSIDIALGTNHYPDPALEWKPLWREQLVALVPSEHRMARQTQVDLADLAHEPLLTFKSGHTLRRMVEELARGGGFTPNIVFEGDDASTLVGLAAAGFGIALVPECVARTSRKAVPVRLRSRQWRTIGVASLKSRYLPPLAGRFVEDLLHRGIRSVSAYTS